MTTTYPTTVQAIHSIISLHIKPHKTTTMSKSKAPVFFGLTAAGGIGYYLYSAGGNPKAAEKKFESMPVTLFLRSRNLMLTTAIPGDIHKASAEVKSHLPGRTVDAQNKGAQVGAKLDEAGAKLDSAVCSHQSLEKKREKKIIK